MPEQIQSINIMINNICNNFIIQTIMPVIKSNNEHGGQAYIVGGFMRDCLLNKKSCDVDIVVKRGHAQVFSKKLANEINGYFVELDNENNIYRVVFPDKENYVDIADCVGETIQQDLLRRDFTINAIAYDLLNNELIDIVNAKEDLQKGIIKEISKENMLDDPIRILRAFRFQSQLGFEFAQSLNEIIKEYSTKTNEPAKERVNVELVKLFGGKYAHEVIPELDKHGILEMLIPEVKEIKRIPPNSHHHLDLFHHCIETVKQVQAFYEQSQIDVKKHLDQEIFAHTRLAYLKIGAFLHDIGKPQTWQIEPETGRHRFIMHESIGAEIIVPTLKNLKFSKKQIAYIQKIIKYHIYPAGVTTSDESSEKAYLRFYRKMEDEVIDLIAIAYADRMSALGEEITQNVLNKSIDGLNRLLNGYFEQKEKLAPLPKLLDGKEIMKLLNIEQSPLLGKIITQLKEAQISSEVTTKSQAIEFVKDYYNSLKH